MESEKCIVCNSVERITKHRAMASRCNDCTKLVCMFCAKKCSSCSNMFCGCSKILFNTCKTCRKRVGLFV